MKELESELKSNNFKFLLKGFREWLQIKGYVKNTCEVYPYHLIEFFSYLEKQNILDIQKVEPKHSAGFKLHLQYRSNKKRLGGIQNQSINGILKVMNCFSKFITETQERFSYDIYEDYLPVEIVGSRAILTQDEIKQIYDATYEQYPNIHGSQALGERDRAVLAVFYGCGLRLAEVRNLNLSDIDFENRRLIVRKGKGNKQRYVPIPNQHLEDLRTYIQNGRYWFTEHHHQVNMCYKYTYKKKVTQDDQEALLLNQNGKRMKSFGTRIKYLVEKCGIQIHISHHNLRHSVATHLLQNGLDLEWIRRFLGHASIDTTQIYCQIVEELKTKKDINDGE